MRAVVVRHLDFRQFLRKLRKWFLRLGVTSRCTSVEKSTFPQGPRNSTEKVNKPSTLNMLSKSFSVQVLLLHQNSLTSPRAQVNQVERWRQAVDFTEVSTYKTLDSIFSSFFHLEVDWCRDGMLCSCGWDVALWSNGNLCLFFFSKLRAVEAEMLRTWFGSQSSRIPSQVAVPVKVWVGDSCCVFAGDPTIRSQILAQKPDILAVPVWDKGQSEGLGRDRQLIRFQHVSVQIKNWCRSNLCQNSMRIMLFLFAVATEKHTKTKADILNTDL